MKLIELIQRVRSLTRDLTSSIFSEGDIIAFINEGINRMKQVIPELETMPLLLGKENIPQLLPSQYHHLLAIYSASRCFNQDERHYQASNFMNEFEVKLEELLMKIEAGDVIIRDSNGNPVVNPSTNKTDYVVDNYFFKRNSYIDLDNGVEGVE